MIILRLLGILLAFGSLTNGVESNPITTANADQIEQIAELYQAESGRQISDLAFNLDGSILAFVDTPASFADGHLSFYDPQTLAPIVWDIAPEIFGNRLAFNHSGDQLLVGNEAGEISVFDTDDMLLAETLSVSNGGGIQAIAISPNDKYIAVSANSTERIGDYAFYISTIEDDPGILLPTSESLVSFGTAFHPSNDFVAYAGNKPEGQTPIIGVRVWRLEDYHQIAYCGDYQPFVDDIVITHDGSYLIYSAVDGVRLWDMKDCIEHPDSWSILAPRQDDFHVSALALHPSDPILAIGYGVRTEDYGCCVGLIQLWDIDTGRLLTVLQGFADDTFSTVLTLAFSPDGTMLASGGTDGTVRLWGIPAGE